MANSKGISMRDSKNILHAKLGVSPMERQYGGGLDDAYMNRRRSSAFAAPDATSAFDSPMSKNGLPTIYREQGGPLPITSVYGQGIPRIVYRENGGGLPTVYRQDPGQVGDGMDDDYTESELSNIGGSGISIEGVSFEDPYGPTGEDDWTTEKAQAQLRAMRGPSKTADELLEDTSLGYTPLELATIYGRKEGKDNQETASRMRQKILSNDGNTMLNDTLFRMFGSNADEVRANMTPQQLANFQSAYDGKSFGGDLKADDFSKGYRYGGARGTLQDILEKGTADQLGLKDFFEGQDETKLKKKEGIEDLISKGIDMVSLTKNMTPENITSLNNMLENKNFEFTPNNKFASGVVSFVAPTIGKAAISLLGGEKTVGTITNKETGTSYQVGDRGGLTLNMPDPDIDYGNDEEIIEKEEVVVTEKTPEEVKEKSSMDKNRELKKKRRVDPNIQIIMDIYGLTFEEAQRFLGQSGVGTGGAGEFEGI